MIGYEILCLRAYGQRIRVGVELVIDTECTEDEELPARPERLR